jgi:3-oxoacyl-(acyl-carrier-protein) synthase
MLSPQFVLCAKNCDRRADGCDLNISDKLQEKKIRYALSCSYTYGGQTAAVILKNFDGEMVK